LRETAAGNEDVEGELYHALAMGQVEKVVDELSTLVQKLTLTEWLALLDAVTSAPHEVGASLPDLTRRSGFVHALVVGLWTATDPVCGSDRSALYWRIAEGYRELTGHVNDGAENAEALLDVHDLIHRYEQLARRWRRGVTAAHM